MPERAFGVWGWGRRIVVPLVIFSAAMSLFALAVFNPLVLALTQFLIAVDGNPFAGNFDLPRFLVTLPGILAAALLTGSAILLWAIQFGGLLLIAWSGRQGRTPRIGRIAASLARRLPQLLLLSAFGFAVAAVLAVPVVLTALAAKWLWLSGGDIYFYVSTRPPELFYAGAAVGVVALAALCLAVFALLRWLMAVAFCAIGGHSARDALRLSAERGKGSRRAFLIRLLLVAAIVALLSAGVTAMFTFFFETIFRAGQSLGTTSRLLVLFVGTATIAAAFVSAIGHALLAMICTEQYATLKGKARVLRSTATTLRRTRWAAAAACLGLPLLAAGQSAWTFDQFTLDEPVRVTAHRAGSRAAPENTLAALDRAIGAGADYAEIDVQETRDGEVIVFHDTDFRRIAGVPRNVWDVDLADTLQFDAGAWFGPDFAGERIPTLRAFADRAKGRIRLNVELKDNGHDVDLARRTLAVLEEAGVLEECVITSLSLRLLADVRALDPRVKIGFIASTGIGNMLALDVDFYSLAARIANARFMTQARANGRPTHVWGAVTPSGVVNAILDGAENIITDDPVLTRATVREIADLSPPELTLLNLRRRLARAGLIGGG